MAAKTAKAPNYTDAQTTALIESYTAGVPVDEIAATAGRAVRSVIAKLVREGVYVAPVKAPAKAKDEGPTKKELLAMVRDLMPEVSADVIDGLQNATKDALVALITRLTPVEQEVEAE